MQTGRERACLTRTRDACEKVIAPLFSEIDPGFLSNESEKWSKSEAETIAVNEMLDKYEKRAIGKISYS